MAKRSATESAAILDVCEKLTLIDEEQYGAARETLLRIVSMLVRLVKSQKPGTGTGTGT